MKQGKIYLYDQYVGLLTEDETGFTFAYDADYLASDDAEAVSLTLPLSNRESLEVNCGNYHPHALKEECGNYHPHVLKEECGLFSSTRPERAEAPSPG